MSGTLKPASIQDMAIYTKIAERFNLETLAGQHGVIADGKMAFNEAGLRELMEEVREKERLACLEIVRSCANNFIKSHDMIRARADYKYTH